MKKVSNVLYMIVGILSVLLVACFVIAGVQLLTNQDAILKEAFEIAKQQEGVIPEGATYEDFVAYVAPYMGAIVGVVFGLAAPYLLTAIVGIVGGIGKIKKGGNVLGIILGVLTADLMLLVAGILGAVAGKRAAEEAAPQAE